MDKFDPNGPETEEDGVRAGALRVLKMRHQSQVLRERSRALSQSHSNVPEPSETLINRGSREQSSPAPRASALPPSNEINPVEREMDLLAECISDLNSQLQDWLGFDIPTEGTEDYEMWQMKISLIEQVESISDVYELCEGGDFNLPSVLEDEADE